MKVEDKLREALTRHANAEASVVQKQEQIETCKKELVAAELTVKAEAAAVVRVMRAVGMESKTLCFNGFRYSLTSYEGGSHMLVKKADTGTLIL